MALCILCRVVFDVVLTRAVRLECVTLRGLTISCAASLVACTSVAAVWLCFELSVGGCVPVLLLPGQLCFGLQCLLLCTRVGCFHFASWRYLLCIFIPYEHWKSRTDCGSFRLFLLCGRAVEAAVACTFLYFCNRTGPLQNGSLAGVAHLL